jgi:hypothetical protein
MTPITINDYKFGASGANFRPEISQFGLFRLAENCTQLDFGDGSTFRDARLRTRG